MGSCYCSSDNQRGNSLLGNMEKMVKHHHYNLFVTLQGQEDPLLHIQKKEPFPELRLYPQDHIIEMKRIEDEGNRYRSEL